MNLNKFTNFGSLLGGILLLIGIFLENQQINLFWESRDIGFAILLLSIGTHICINTTFKIYKIRSETRQGWIGFFQVIFSVIFMGQLLFANFSTSFIAAKQIVLSNSTITNQLGNIDGFGILINGVPAIISKKETNIALLIKGEKKYERYIVQLQSKDGSWQLKKLKKDR